MLPAAMAEKAWSACAVPHKVMSDCRTRGLERVLDFEFAGHQWQTRFTISYVLNALGVTWDAHMHVSAHFSILLLL